MKIPGIDAYNNPYVNKTESQPELSKVINKSEKTDARQGSADIKLNLEKPNEIVTKNERDFFIKMFPENSEQLNNHILFNRNGKLQSINLMKGMIIDGRV